MVRDPVCGMTIGDKDAAAAYTSRGKTYYFCSPSCLIVFEKNPQVYENSKRVESMSSLDKRVP